MNPNQSKSIRINPSLDLSKLNFLIRINPGHSEPIRKRFISHLMKNGQNSVRLNLIQSEWIRTNPSMDCYKPNFLFGINSSHSEPIQKTISISFDAKRSKSIRLNLIQSEWIRTNPNESEPIQINSNQSEHGLI